MENIGEKLPAATETARLPRIGVIIIMPIRSGLLSLMLLVPSLADGEKPSFAPSFYPFQNGVRFATPEAGVKVLKELGYGGIGSVYGKDLAQYRKACDGTGLKIFSIYVGGGVKADGYSYDPVVTEAIALLKGSDTIVELFIGGKVEHADEHAVAFVKEIAGHAKKSGLRVVLYPHSGFYIDTVGDALRIAKASGCDNVGVIFNLCHFLKVEPESDLRKTLEEAMPLLWSVSVSGAEPGGTNWKQLIQPLDEGSFDQIALLRNLREIGFSGPVGLQCYAIKIDPRENLRRSITAWKKILAASREEEAQEGKKR